MLAYLVHSCATAATLDLTLGSPSRKRICSVRPGFHSFFLSSAIDRAWGGWFISSGPARFAGFSIMAASCAWSVISGGNTRSIHILIGCSLASVIVLPPLLCQNRTQ